MFFIQRRVDELQKTNVVSPGLTELQDIASLHIILPLQGCGMRCIIIILLNSSRRERANICLTVMFAVEDLDSIVQAYHHDNSPVSSNFRSLANVF